MRNRLVAEHLNLSAEEVEAGLEAAGGACGLVDSRAAEERTLLPLHGRENAAEPLSEVLAPIADPERPFGAPGGWAEDSGSAREPDYRRIAWTVVAVLAAMAGIVLAWCYTPLSEIADIEVVKPWFQAVRGSAWAPAVVPAVYAAASLFLFPVTVLITVTGMIFGPLWGLVYSMAGCLSGGAVTFLVGVAFGRVMLIDRLGAQAPKVVRFLRDRGVVTVALIRIVPVAPFGVVNVMAGAARVRFRDFMLGTTLGMAPGAAVMTLLGDQFRRLWEDPGPANIGLLVGLVVIWLGLTFLVQRLVARWRRARA